MLHDKHSVSLIYRNSDCIFNKRVLRVPLVKRFFMLRYVTHMKSLNSYF